MAVVDVYHRGGFTLGSIAMPGGLDLRAMLLKSPFAFNDEHNTVSQINGDIISGAGYSDATLTTVTWTEDDTNNRSELAADRASFGSIIAGEQVTDCVVFEQVGLVLICRITLTNTNTNGQLFSVDFGGSDPGPILYMNTGP